MPKSNDSKACPTRRRPGGALLVGMVSVAAAWILTACDAGFVEPVLMAVLPSASAAENPHPFFGEISSIEPIKQSADKKSAAQPVGYRIHIRLDDGSTRSIDREQLNGLDVGARVRIEAGQLKQV